VLFENLENLKPITEMFQLSVSSFMATQCDAYAAGAHLE
jgi:hypothetical protein